MARSGRELAAKAQLILWPLVATALGADHAPRELPPNALQRPGASFEQQITWQQR